MIFVNQDQKIIVTDELALEHTNVQGLIKWVPFRIN